MTVLLANRQRSPRRAPRLCHRVMRHFLIQKVAAPSCSISTLPGRGQAPTAPRALIVPSRLAHRLSPLSPAATTPAVSAPVVAEPAHPALRAASGTYQQSPDLLTSRPRPQQSTPFS